MCADEQIRIWKCLTGKLFKKIDESLAAAAAAQAEEGPNTLDALDFGKRMSVEKELVKEMASSGAAVMHFVVLVFLLRGISRAPQRHCLVRSGGDAVG
jgi:hypothetical protein